MTNRDYDYDRQRSGREDDWSRGDTGARNQDWSGQSGSDRMRGSQGDHWSNRDFDRQGYGGQSMMNRDYDRQGNDPYGGQGMRQGYDQYSGQGSRQDYDQYSSQGMRGRYDQGMRQGNAAYGGQGMQGRYDQGMRQGNDPYGGQGMRGGSGGSQQGYSGDRGYDYQSGQVGYGNQTNYSGGTYGGQSSFGSMSYGDQGSSGGMSRGQFTGRGPKGYQRSDQRIEEDVCERLSQHGQIDATNIEVTVSNGDVTLSGTVDDRQTKRLAEDVVESISGVKDVHNQIRVQRGGMMGLPNAQAGQSQSGAQGMQSQSTQAGQSQAGTQQREVGRS